MAIRLGASALIILITLGLDQLSKWYVLTDLMNPPIPIDVTNFFQLVLVWNKGVSFGMFGSADLTWVLAIVAIVVTIILSGWLFQAKTLFLSSAIALVVGGAIGNIIDRIRFGAVIDFLYFHIGEYYWPAFNVADAAICVGVGLILIDGLLLSKEQPKTEDN